MRNTLVGFYLTGLLFASSAMAADHTELLFSQATLREARTMLGNDNVAGACVRIKRSADSFALRNQSSSLELTSVAGHAAWSSLLEKSEVSSLTKSLSRDLPTLYRDCLSDYSETEVIPGLYKHFRLKRNIKTAVEKLDRLTALTDGQRMMGDGDRRSNNAVFKILPVERVGDSQAAPSGENSASVANAR